MTADPHHEGCVIRCALKGCHKAPETGYLVQLCRDHRATLIARYQGTPPSTWRAA